MAGRILIADDVMTNRIILKARLGAAAFVPLQAASAEETLAVALAETPDIVLLSDTLGDGGSAQICQRLRAHRLTSHIPIIILAEDRSRDARLRALEAGADAVLARLPDDAILRARIGNLLRRNTTEQELTRSGAQTDAYEMAEAPVAFTPPCQIVLIAPSLAEGLKWRNGLATRLRDHIAVIDPAQALIELDREPPADAVVIAERPDQPGDAMQILSDLRCRSETFRAATVVVQAQPDMQRAIMALNLGASDLVDEGFDAEELALILRRELKRKAQNDSRRAALKDGLRLSVTDPLTGLFNRRYAMAQLDRLAQTAPERGEQFAVMVLDLDRFKRINDQYGHSAGDAVLTEIASRMADCLRRDDFLARIGGEEFLAVIRACDLETAQIAAERLRRAVADQPVILPGGKGAEQMTMSIGLVIGGGPDVPEDPAALIDLADRGLYSAKAEGRNQVTVYQSAA